MFFVQSYPPYLRLMLTAGLFPRADACGGALVHQQFQGSSFDSVKSMAQYICNAFL